jgi:hypothetical protein
VQQLRVEKEQGLVAFTLQVPSFAVSIKPETRSNNNHRAAADNARVPGEGAVQAVVQVSGRLPVDCNLLEEFATGFWFRV